jgi:hypothetical protein
MVAELMRFQSSEEPLGPEVTRDCGGVLPATDFRHFKLWRFE